MRERKLLEIDSLAREVADQKALLDTRHRALDSVLQRLTSQREKLQRDARSEKHALETGNGALLCDGAARNGQGRDQQRFFTGKLHNNTRFLYLRR